MTLEELADFVCGKTGFTDVESVKQCKKFLRARYKSIWDSQLWRTSLGLLDVQAGLFDPNPEVCLPKEYERIVSARYTGIAGEADGLGGPIPVDVNASPMTPVDLTSLFQQDPGWYERSGTPAEYAVSFPVALPFVAPPSQEYAVKADSQHVSSGVGFAGVSAMNGQKCVIRGVDKTGRRIEEELTLAITGDVSTFWVTATTTAAFAYVTQVIKPATLLPVTFQMGGLFESALTLEKDETNSLPIVHFRLTRRPAANTRLLVLAKRRIYDLTKDNDLTELPNVDNALIAFAQSDMLERARQYNKAEKKLKDAGAEMRILIDLEAYQAANVMRIIPDVQDAHSWEGLLGV